jgi:cytochrome c
MRKIWMVGMLGLVAMAAAPAQAAGDAAKGAADFGRCAICHANTKGGANKIGPNLFGVVGRKAGTAPDFSYSAAMKSAGFVWTADKLNAYIKAPAAVVPGNKMAFAGLPQDGLRADLVAYLGTLK